MLEHIALDRFAFKMMVPIYFPQIAKASNMAVN